MRKVPGFLLTIALVFFVFLPGHLYAQGSIQQILQNGATDKRLNIVILSEGYTNLELAKYLADANTLLNALLATQPFQEYAGYFNAFAISIASNESGSDHPSRNIFRDTYFNSTYDSFGIQRLISISSEGLGKVYTLLQNLMPEYDLVMMIVNDAEYGGAGGFPALTSLHSSAPEIVVHELGHSFAGLGDEYDSPFPGYPDIEEPNTTRETQREFIKWRPWILGGTPIPTPSLSQYGAVVGLFEGAHYHATGWFRPKLNCKMRALGVDFCEVCRETLVKSKYELIRPIESFFPAATTIVLSGMESVPLKITPMKPATHSMMIQWRVDGQIVNGAAGETFQISAPALGNGTHQIKVKVRDSTAFVRNDSTQLLSDSTAWTINVSGVTAVAETPLRQIPMQYNLEQNYPNPIQTYAANPISTIRYALPRAAHVKLAVYNIRGEPVAELVDAIQPAGEYQTNFVAKNLANGLYFYRLQAGDFVLTKKLILLK